MLFKIILNKDQQKLKKLPNADYYFSLLQLSESQDDDYLETILNKDIEWYNDIQRQYLSEYIANVISYKTLQLSQSDRIIKYLYS